MVVVGGGHLGCILDLGLMLTVSPVLCTPLCVVYSAPCRSACAVCRALLRVYADRMLIAARDAMLCPIHACRPWCGNFDIIFISFHSFSELWDQFSRISQPCATLTAVCRVRCSYLECTLCWMLIGACNPMLCPIHVLGLLRPRGPVGPGDLRTNCKIKGAG